MERRAFYLPEATFTVTIDGRVVTESKVAAAGGYRRAHTYASDRAARRRFDALCASHGEPARKRTGRAIAAPRVKASRPLGREELTRIAAQLGGAASPWSAADVVAIERALSVRERPVKLPTSYTAFVRCMGAMSPLLSAREVVRDTKRLVRVPRGTQWETPDGHAHTITTDHLVAFAADGPEARWCFCIDPAAGGPSVYRHHQDEPRALDAMTRSWLDRRSARPEFADFPAWLRATSRAIARAKPSR